MSDTSKVLATKFTDDRFPIEWKDEGEKSLMWFYDDLHCPNPISPLYFDIGGWWDCDGRWGADCTYMYQRFGAPIGKAWIAKKIGGYVYSAVVPPETDADKVWDLSDAVCDVCDYIEMNVEAKADSHYRRPEKSSRW